MSMMGPMGEPKQFASLTSGLLARKGGAKPAMRRQALDFGHNGQLTPQALEDLGWNDMGEDHVQPDAEPVGLNSLTALTPMPFAPVEEAVAAPEPIFAPAWQEEAEAAVMQPAPVEIAPVEAAPVEPVADAIEAVEAKPVRAANGASGKGKSAFTLRLDPERHLKLRLACAVSHRSAQQIVTDALDDYLGKLPDIARLAGQVPAGGAK